MHITLQHQGFLKNIEEHQGHTLLNMIKQIKYQPNITICNHNQPSWGKYGDIMGGPRWFYREQVAVDNGWDALGICSIL